MPYRSDAVAQADVREHNLSRVLDLVSLRGSLTRDEIARVTDLHLTSVANIVGELKALGMVQETHTSPNGRRGRTPAVIRVAGHVAGLGLEVRTDGIVAFAQDALGRPRYRRSIPGPQTIRRASVIVADLREILRHAEAELASQELTLGAATVLLPGEIHRCGGRFTVPQLGWTGVDLALDRPGLNVESSRSFLSLAEYAAQPEAMLYVMADGGVGARLVVDGQVVRSPGAGFRDGFGHLALPGETRVCGCGRRGCLQTRLRRSALLHDAGLGDGTMTDLQRHAEAGSAHALGALKVAGRALAAALANVLNLVAVPTVVLGGDLAALGPWIVPEIEAELQRRVLGSGPDWPRVRAALQAPDAAVHAAASSGARSSRAVLERP